MGFPIRENRRGRAESYCSGAMGGDCGTIDWAVRAENAGDHMRVGGHLGPLGGIAKGRLRHIPWRKSYLWAGGISAIVPNPGCLVGTSLESKVGNLAYGELAMIHELPDSRVRATGTFPGIM